MEKLNLVCDPWVGKIKENAWHSFPVYKNGIAHLKKINPGFIYISHLHTDHLDRKLLSKWAKFKPNCKIIIKKFKDERLKKNLKSLGFKKFFEFEEWKIYDIENHKIVIIPQMTSNKDGIKTSIEYDLDTSILIYSKKTKKIFFNNVDNPLSEKDIIIINKFVKKNFKTNIHIACFPVGAASEYPQCFLNINRAKEKKKVIAKSLETTRNKLEIIKPDVFFQAGGTYILYGKFAELNKYIAQPDETKDFKKILPQNSKFAEIEGNGYIQFQNNQWQIKRNTVDLKILKKKLEKKIKKIDYDYLKLKIDKKNLDKIFEKAKDNYLQKLLRFKVNTSWSIDFYVYDNLKINNLVIDKKKSKLFKKYSVKYKSKKNTQNSKLLVYIDIQLFYLLLKRAYPWNISLSGSYILYKRYPNKFDPNVTFSLNFLCC
jgi:hypothetical protein